MTDECDHDWEPSIALDLMGGTREFVECTICHEWEDR